MKVSFVFIYDKTLYNIKIKWKINILFKILINSTYILYKLQYLQPLVFSQFEAKDIVFIKKDEFMSFVSACYRI